jgi:peptidoglycan/LPS O-acetylase OafA/YrhL
MDYEGVIDTLMTNNIHALTLLIGGLLAILIAIFYVKSRDSAKYKLLMLIGTIFGVFMAFIAFNTYGELFIATSVIMIIAAFTLIIRPFKEIHFALLIALMVMCIIYMLLGGLEGTQLEILSEGWYRVGVAFFCGAMVYMMLHMVESIVKMIAKILNAWPILFILGMICVIEAVMVFTGNGSVYDLIRVSE